MALETSAEITVAVDRAAAFAVVQDPVRLARCIPGCKDLQQLAPDRYSAVLTSRVAFMTLSFKVTIDVLRMEPPETLEARVTGDAIGLAGHVVATANMRLMEAGPQRTLIRYTTDVGLTGKLGGLGQPVFRATSAKLAREFGDNLKTEIERGQTSE
jgi:carbon monoxide dehydrogenase subunit G